MGTVIVEQEKSEDTKGVIGCKSKKDTYHCMLRMAFFKV